MAKLAEILRTGQAPGINTKALDPGCPRAAIPRALRRLEIDMGGATRTARACQSSVKRLRKVWNI